MNISLFTNIKCWFLAVTSSNLRKKYHWKERNILELVISALWAKLYNFCHKYVYVFLFFILHDFRDSSMDWEFLLDEMRRFSNKIAIANGFPDMMSLKKSRIVQNYHCLWISTKIIILLNRNKVHANFYFTKCHWILIFQTNGGFSSKSAGDLSKSVLITIVNTRYISFFALPMEHPIINVISFDFSPR